MNIFFSSLFLHAADKTNIQLEVFPVQENKAFNLKAGFYLFWLPKFKENTYSIYANEKLIETVNTPSTLAEIHDLLTDKKSRDVFYTFLKKQGYKKQDNLQSFIKKNYDTLLFYSFYNKTLSKILGSSTFIPKEKIPFKKVKFKIISNQYIGISSNINAQNYPRVPSPKKIETQSYNEGILLKWLHPVRSSIASYNIYYKEKKDKLFQKANKKPIIVFKPSYNKKSNISKKVNGIHNIPGNFFIPKLKNKKTYLLYMRSFHFNGMPSKKSKVYSVIPKKKAIPIPPTIIKIKQKNNHLSIQWEHKPTKDYNTLAHYYHIYRSLQLKGPYKRLNKLPIPNTIVFFDDINAIEYAQHYWYRVQAVSKEGNESPTSVAKFGSLQKPIILPKVVIQSLQANKGFVAIKFKNLKFNHIYSYEIYRKSSLKSELNKITTIKYTNKKLYVFKDKNIQAHSTYCYIIRARDKFGFLSLKNKPKCIQTKNHFALGLVNDFWGHPESQQVYLTWNFTPHFLLKGFFIKKYLKKNHQLKEIAGFSIPKKKRSFLDKNVEEGMTYYYSMQTIAKNNIVGKLTRKISIFVPSILPKQVNALSVFYNKKTQYAFLRWKYPNNKIQHFKLYILNQNTSEEISYIIKKNLREFKFKVNPSIDYEFYIKAVNQFNKEGLISEIRLLKAH